MLRLCSKSAVYTQVVSFHPLLEKGIKLFSILAIGFLAIAAVFAVAIVMALRSGAEREWSFELSRVIGDAFVAIGRAPVLFGVLAISSSVVPILTLAGMSSGRGVGLIGLLTFAWYQFATVAMIAAALTALDDQPVRVAALLRRVAPLVPRAMLISLLYWVAVGIGFFLLIVPGVILACVWMLVLPVLIAERPALFATFGRSAALTRGVRWHLFLLAVIGFVFGVVMQGMLGAIAALFGGNAVSMIAYFLLTSLMGMLPPALVASAYRAVAVGREGLRGQRLEEIFA
jgi:TRAP-type mannitol/chloroaromatic compound transport system permease small subunit